MVENLNIMRLKTPAKGQSNGLKIKEALQTTQKKRKMGRKLNRAEAQIETKHLNTGIMTKNRRGKRPNG